MGVITFEHEVSSSIPAPKLFKAFILDGDNLIPKVMPQAIKSVETLQGDGGPGTIKLITFGEGSQFKSVKHRIDEVDKEKEVYKYTVIEGDALKGIIDSISYVVKIEASENGGSVCKTTSHYHVKDEADHGITEEKIKEGKEKAKAMFHAIEAYLHAHPEY
ncbi:major allergen Pru av 1-like [Henckelia pumila]|uniref:major allergen Pru av 1-like n=1 Tax=Henckelia pumila TaxID=405737 RepID=UPI003C6E7712